MKRRAALCLLLGAVVAWVFYRQRAFFPEHAALVGLAVAAFGYSVLRVLDNLRSAARNLTPGNQQESEDQEAVDQTSQGPAGEQKQQPGGHGDGRGE